MQRNMALALVTVLAATTLLSGCVIRTRDRYSQRSHPVHRSHPGRGNAYGHHKHDHRFQDTQPSHEWAQPASTKTDL